MSKKPATTEPSTKATSFKITTIEANSLFIGLAQLSKLDIEDFNTTLKITDNIEELENIGKSYEKTIHSLRKKHLEIDDKGNFIVQKNMYQFKSTKDKNDFNKSFDDLSNKSVDVNLYIIKLSMLKDVAGIKSETLKNCKLILVKNVEIETES